MAENETKKSNRELLMERLNAKYPNRQYADDDDFFGQIGDDYQSYDDRIKQYEDSEGKFVGMLDSNPVAAQFVTALARGEQLVPLLVKLIGLDNISKIVNDPEMQKELEEANADYVKRVAESKHLEEEAAKNDAETLKTREEFDAQYGEDVVDAAAAWIAQVMKDAMVGIVRRETFETAIKAINHDSEVEAAREEGMIAGRNAKIDEGKLRKANAGDGLPAMGGTNNAPTRNKNKRFNIFDYAEAAN